LNVFLFSSVWVEHHNLNVGKSEHFLGESGVVVFVEDDSHDTCLDDDLGAELTREGGRVDCPAHGAWSACFDDGRFLSVKAKALVEVDSLHDVIVASLAAALIAVAKPKRSAVVTRGDYTIILGDDGAVATLHAVGSCCRKFGKAHEVSVESWPDKFLVVELKVSERLVEGQHGVCLIVEPPPDHLLVLGVARVERVLLCVESNLVVEVDEVC
jgi:hypothetical protein